MIVFLLVLILAVSAFGQDGVQTKTISDFSGGLVNSLSNSLMQDNQATRFEDINVTDIGWMKARPGYRLVYSDAYNGNTSNFVIPSYMDQFSRRLLIWRKRPSVFGSGANNDTLSLNTLALLACNDVTLTCTTLVTRGFYKDDRNVNVPSGSYSTTLPIGQVVGAANSEPLLLKNTGAYNLRPLGPGQMSVYGLSGGGALTGTYRYRVMPFDTSANDSMMFSLPTWWVSVVKGKVVIRDFPRRLDTTKQDKWIIYREQNNDGYWRRLATVLPSDSSYVDNTATIALSDTSRWRTGRYQPIAKAPTTSNEASVTEENLTPPAVTITPDSTGGTLKVKNFTGVIPQLYLSYAIGYEDSVGGLSMFAGPFVAQTRLSDANDTLMSIAITNIPPVPSWCKRQLVIRRYADDQPSSMKYAEYKWYFDSYLSRSATSYNDTAYLDANADGKLLGDIGIIDTVVRHYTINYFDSLLSFQPSSIAAFNSRVFAVGDPLNKNYVYYSDFGRPNIWPPDHVLSLTSRQGDWANGLFPLGDRLLIFMQNSIYHLVGANFYQFQLDEIANNVGLSGPRTLAGSQNEVFFAHQTGIYEIPRGGAISNAPISLPIQNSFDSTASSELTANGVVIGRDYWYSPAPTVYPKTYIYTALPQPHWKVYTIGVKAAALYDPDTTAVDFASRKYILLNNYDHLLRWDYTDTSDFDAAGAQLETPISPLYQSKYFFEGPTRTKVQYVDIEATGACAYLTVKLVCNYGDTTLTQTLILPDFGSERKIRVPFGRTVKNAAVRLEWEGAGLVVKSYTIGYIPWDGGKL